MTTFHYKYHPDPVQPQQRKKSVPVITLDDSQAIGHGDHFAIISDDPATALPSLLQDSLERASVPQGLSSCKTCDDYLLLGSNDSCHISQVFRLVDGKPSELKNVFPAVNSPYGITCKIDKVILNPDSTDAILALSTADGTSLYAFDKLYAINHCHYDAEQSYYVNLSAWAYDLQKSHQDERIVVDDPDAIRYHRAFNDIVSNNNGQVPDDIDAQIRAWQPADDTPLAPVEINLGHSCIYLFGETFAQEDEAWCQGQVLGKSQTQAFGRDISLFDVVILREPDADPVVVRIAAITNASTDAIDVHDYIQANIWLQAAIYATTQKPKQPKQATSAQA